MDARDWHHAAIAWRRALRRAGIGPGALVQRPLFSKAVLLVVLSLFWIATGLISIGPGYEAGVALMREGGAGSLSAPSVIAGGLADIAIGLAIAFRRTCRLGLYAALAITIFYLIAGTALLPRLWIEPLGPLLKAIPIFVLHLVALAIIEDR